MSCYWGGILRLVERGSEERVPHPPVLWSIQENVLSTTHLLGSTTNPCGGRSFRQSTFAPSLDHSLAHAISTSSGAALRGRLTISTLQPSVFFTQSAPLASPR